MDALVRACTVYCVGSLLYYVQMTGLFQDGKTFVDMPMKYDPEIVSMHWKSWLEDELGTEKTALMAVLAKHRVQIPGGGDEAKALLEELLEWKAEGVVNARSTDAAD